MISNNEEDGNNFNPETESVNSDDRLEGIDSRKIPTTEEIDEHEECRKVVHLESLIESQVSQMNYKSDAEEEEYAGEIKDIEHIELDQKERKSPNYDSPVEESGKLTMDDQTGDQSFQDDDEFQVVSDDVDHESVESEGHDETDFRSSVPNNEEIEELNVQANFYLAEGKAFPDGVTREKAEVVTDEKRVEVEEEICKEVIVKRRRAAHSDKSSTNSSVHEDEDLDIEMSIQEQVHEQNAIEAKTTSEIETLIQEIHSDSHEEIVEEVLDEVVLTKKLDQEVGAISDYKDDKSTESNSPQLVDDSAFEVDQNQETNDRNDDLEIFDEEEPNAYTFNEKLSHNVESSELEGRLNWIFNQPLIYFNNIQHVHQLKNI